MRSESDEALERDRREPAGLRGAAGDPPAAELTLLLVSIRLPVELALRIAPVALAVLGGVRRGLPLLRWEARSLLPPAELALLTAPPLGAEFLLLPPGVDSPLPPAEFGRRRTGGEDLSSKALLPPPGLGPRRTGGGGA